MVDWPTGRIDDSLALFSMTMQHAILIGAAIIGARVIALWLLKTPKRAPLDHRVEFAVL